MATKTKIKSTTKKAQVEVTGRICFSLAVPERACEQKIANLAKRKLDDAIAELFTNGCSIMIPELEGLGLGDTRIYITLDHNDLVPMSAIAVADPHNN